MFNFKSNTKDIGKKCLRQAEQNSIIKWFNKVRKGCETYISMAEGPTAMERRALT